MVAGGGGCSPPNNKKFTKISQNETETQPKVGQSFCKQLIFYQAVRLNFYLPHAHGFSTFHLSGVFVAWKVVMMVVVFIQFAAFLSAVLAYIKKGKERTQALVSASCLKCIAGMLLFRIVELVPKALQNFEIKFVKFHCLILQSE